MADAGDRRVAAVLGVIGAVLIGLDGLIDVARGVLYLAIGRGARAFLPFDQGLVFLVVALLIGVFSVLGGVRREASAIVAGAVLVVLAVVGWLALGLGSGLLSVLGTILALVAGVVFLVSGR